MAQTIFLIAAAFAAVFAAANMPALTYRVLK